MTKSSRLFDWIEPLARDLSDRASWKALATRLDGQIHALMSPERAPRLATTAGVVIAIAAGGIWLASASLGSHPTADATAEARVYGLAAPVDALAAAIAEVSVDEPQPGFMDLKSAQALEKAASFTFASRSVDPGTVPPAAFMENLFASPDEVPVAEIAGPFSQTADASAHGTSR